MEDKCRRGIDLSVSVSAKGNECYDGIVEEGIKLETEVNDGLDRKCLHSKVHQSWS